MKFDLDYGLGRYAIRGYRTGAIVVNDETLTQSFIITTDRLVRDWPPQGFEELRVEHLDQIAALGPEIAVLGTGARLRFPSREVTAPLTRHHIGFEVMDTAAACRSFMVLSAEGRRVAAALLMITA
jgi:uncharacterized protein